MKHKSIIVFGLGKFGQSISVELANAGAEVLAIDRDEERAHDVADTVACAVSGDVRDTDTLESLGISNMDAAVVAITGNLDASVMATIFAKEAGVPYILAKAQDEIHGRILQKVGADKVIIPEHESGIRAARQLITGNVLDFVELSKNIRMVEITVRDAWIGHSLQELDLRRTEHINVIAVRKDEEVLVNLHPDMIFERDMTLLVTVAKKDLSALLEKN